METTMLFADKNVLIDSSEYVISAWQELTRLRPLRGRAGVANGFANKAAAIETLGKLGLHDLAEKLKTGTYPLSFMQAYLGAEEEPEDGTRRMETSAQIQQRRKEKSLRELTKAVVKANQRTSGESWVRDLLASGNDPRNNDLAAAGEDGELVTTTDIVLDSKRILFKRNDRNLVNALVYSLLEGSIQLEVPSGLDLRSAIARGVLNPLREHLEEYASEHMALFDLHDPLWRVPENRLTKKIGSNERKVKDPELDGADGEDIFLLWQLVQAEKWINEQHPGNNYKLKLATSDTYAAMVAAQANLCPCSLYNSDSFETKRRGATSELARNAKVPVFTP